MTSALRKVKSGDPLVIPAQTFNTFIDAACDYRQRAQNRGQQAQPGFRKTGIVPVKNVSGYDCGRFDVLGIDSPVFTPTDSLDAFKNQVALKGDTPAASNHVGKFAILLEPVADGEIGRACIDGVCAVKIDVQDEDHAYADIADGQRGYLKSAERGAALILWAESGTGEKWAIVRLGVLSGQGAVMFGKPMTAFTSGTTVTLNPCDIHGADNGKDNVAVYVQADKSSYSMTNSTSIPTTQIVPYCLGDDGNFYLLGTPVEIVTTYRIDGPNRKFQKKTRNVWVLTPGGESDWVDVHTGDACP